MNRPNRVAACEKPQPVRQTAINELTETDRDLLYAYARLYTEITDTFKIPLFAIGGTLLGCVRHAGPIPWDDDIDYCVRAEDERMLSDPALLKCLNEKGFVLFRESHPTYIRVYHIYNIGSPQPIQRSILTLTPAEVGSIAKGKHPNWKTLNNIGSDIFIYSRGASNGVYELCKKRRQCISADNFVLTKYQYGPTEIYSIRDATPYLTELYGEYMTPRRTHQHRS